MPTKQQLVNGGLWADTADKLAGSQLEWIDVACTATLLDAGTRTGKVYVKRPEVVAGQPGARYKVRDIILVGGGTNFGAGGNCLLELKDGTTVWTTIANADLETAPTASLSWGNTKVPYLTGTSNTATTAGADLYFQYQTAGTGHTSGSITFSVCIERVA